MLCNKLGLPSIIAFFVSVWLFTSVAHAAPTVNAGQLLKQQEQIPQASIEAINNEAIEHKKHSSAQSSKTFMFKQIKFSGKISVFTVHELEDLFVDHLNSAITLTQLYILTNKITDLYHSQDFFLARAFLPPQDITNGIVTIHIEEGRRDTSAEGISTNKRAKRLKDHRVHGIIDHAIPSSGPVKLQHLERAVLLIRDLPGISASVNLNKGKTQGTTKFEAEINEGPILHPWLGLDNGGSRITGEYRLNVGLNVNDPFGNGEQFRFMSVKSVGSGDMQYVRVGATKPIGYDGLNVSFDGSLLNYTAGGTLSAADSSGEARKFSISSSYPLLRTRKSNLSVHAAFDFSVLEDRALSITTNDKETKKIRVGLNASHSDKLLLGGYSSAAISFEKGMLDLKVANVRAADSASTGANTQGSYSKFTYNIRRVQRNLPNFFVIGDIKGQLASDNLDSSEKFQLGGPYGVRAYPPGEAQGDIGVKVSLDAHYVINGATSFGDLRLIGFYDWGEIQQYKHIRSIPLDSPNRYSLSGYGVGMNIGRPGDIDFNLFWARRLGSNPAKSATSGLDQDGSKESDRYWFSVNKHF